MVMGPTHAMSGAAAGLALGAFLPAHWGGAESAAELFVFAGVTAGAALLPDLDTPQGTLARSFGLVSTTAAHVVENTSQAIYNVTKTRKDDPINNGHRTATHTIWFALLAGGAVSALVGSFGKTAAVGVLFFMLGLAIRGLAPTWTKKQDWLYVTGLSLALALAVWAILPASAGSAALGAAVAVGCLTHLLGDMITKRGVPLLGGVVSIGGKRWWDFGPPAPLRIRANGMADRILLSACTGAVFLLSYYALADPTVLGGDFAAVAVALP